MKSFKKFINEVKKPTGDLKKACWTGYTAVGMKMKGGRKVPNCVPEEVEIVYEANIQPTSAKSRSHISNLSNPTVNSVTHKSKQIGLITKQSDGSFHAHHSAAKLSHAQSGTFDTKDKAHQFIRNAHANAIKKGTLSDKFLKKEEIELDETAAWQRKEGKRESGGLNQKGVDSYRREHPGSKLKTAVTTKPSKLKPGSAAANRRKSFCARMSGMKKRLTSAKTAHDPNSRINKSLRKWNC